MVSESRETSSSFLERVRNPVTDNDAEHWARTCATGGSAVWVGLAVLARMGLARVGAIELLFLFAPLVIVPLGMELARVLGGSNRARDLAWYVQPFGAACVVLAILFPPGKWAGTITLGWMMVCLLVGSAGLIDIFSAPWSTAGRSVRVTVAIAGIDLVVGGAWLLASRFGMRPMGIQEPIGLLTAVHFHFAGFATAMIAAATVRFAQIRDGGWWMRRLTGMVIGMPFVVAAGFVISARLKVAAAIVFSMSVAGLAVCLRAYAQKVGSAEARRMLQIAAATVFAGMVLSVAYAIADFMGHDSSIIPQMARTHGILNAVGFCLPGLLGWLMESSWQRLENRAGVD
jgi:YndJ-like protein